MVKPLLLITLSVSAAAWKFSFNCYCDHQNSIIYLPIHVYHYKHNDLVESYWCYYYSEGKEKKNHLWNWSSLSARVFCVMIYLIKAIFNIKIIKIRYTKQWKTTSCRVIISLVIGCRYYGLVMVECFMRTSTRRKKLLIHDGVCIEKFFFSKF